MPRTIVLVVLAATALIGVVRIVVRLLGVQRKKRFAGRYLARLRAVADDTPEAEHDWLARHLTRLQADLGPLAYSARTATPYEPLPTADTPVLKTVLRQVRDARTRPEGLDTSEELFMRHLGLLDEARRRVVLELVNPLRWLGEGIRVALLLPALILQGLGLLRPATVGRIEESLVFRALAGFVTIAGLALATAVLLVGWESVQESAAALVERMQPAPEPE